MPQPHVFFRSVDDLNRDQCANARIPSLDHRDTLIGGSGCAFDNAEFNLGKDPPIVKNFKILAACAALVSSPAFAQSGDGDASGNADEGNWSGFISAGPGVAPEFDGSSDLQIIPFISADIKYKDVTLEVRGLGARLDVLSAIGSGRVYGGPAVNFKLPRTTSLGKLGEPVRFLNKVSFEPQAGGFIGVKIGGNENGKGEFRIEATALTGDKGFEATGRISYALVRSRKVFVDISNGVTYANAKATRTYFGVTAAEATRSGLVAFNPGAGIRDVNSGLTIGYQFNSRWGIVANTNYSYLVGDAGKSPIVKGRLTGTAANKAEGSRSQFVGGIGILFNF
jgi:MipA family protein